MLRARTKSVIHRKIYRKTLISEMLKKQSKKEVREREESSITSRFLIFVCWLGNYDSNFKASIVK